MKIKRERKVRLDELLKYVWSNNVKNKTFESTDGDSEVYFNDFGFVKIDIPVADEDLFEIEEEVEITEDMKLDLVVIEYEGYIARHNNVCINSLLTKIMDVKFIYLKNDDGSIGQLIWKDGEIVE